ncbi:DUF2484 family protein [Paracoccus sp. Z330]|uniref:DUF2484 family protein n=1 Tax=Paracoccus onchidii TaxID=3017813 RepID=A0ABT4ZDW1_9RHOB|nr:DUF2484 family protein [Paracoccus onchidii]MDB6177534.1 DUF2484 family protein [Paracoccus onchidii]
MTSVQIIALGMSCAWLILAIALPRRGEVGDLRVFWGLIAFGVPVLGLVTLNWGPMAGAAGFALGLALLLRPPRQQRQDGGIAPLE